MTTYDYIDYRKYLKAAVLAKKASSPSINFSRIAEEVGVQRSYLSQVFGFKCHLNSDQLYVIAKKLGLGEKEIEYLLILLDVEKSQVSARREKLIHLRDSLRNAHFKSENYLDRKTLKIDNGIYSQYYTDPYCSLVHMYLLIPNFRNHPSSITEELGLSQEKLDEILQVLLRLKLIEMAKGKVKVLVETLHLVEDSFLSKTNATMFRLKAIENQMRGNVESDYFFTASISADAETKNAIKRKFLEFLKEVSKLVDSAPAKKVFHLNFDLFSS
jgi:uncharacterized protein (TIGR02147 family)